MSLWKSFIIATLLLFASHVPASSAGEQGELRLLLKDGPGGAPAFLRPAHPVSSQARQVWLQRIGAKKGFSDPSIEEAAEAAPDFAVLARGYSEQWPDILAEMRELYAMAEPGSVAGLAGTKPVLIIPTGGLSGTAGSEFFKAGLAAYVQEGGTLICFAQRNGGDYAALPVPPGSRLDGAGWSEDPRPYYGASLVRSPHPLLAHVSSAAPRIETSGYLTSLPPGAETVLARTDGRPTLVVYPFGAGRVVVAALFSDMLSGTGFLGPEEGALVRDLLLWAKAPRETASASPGNTFNVSLTLHGGAQDAAAAKLLFIGSGSAAPAWEQIVNAPVRASQTISLPLPFNVPPDAPPGIYHFEYILLDRMNRPISAQFEAAEGRMAVIRPVVADTKAFSALPQQAATPGSVRIRTALTPAEQKMLLTVEIEADASSPLFRGEVIVTVRGWERRAVLSWGRARLAFDITESEALRPVPLSLYTGSGMLLLRERVPPAAADHPGVLLDRFSFAPGQNMRVRMHGLESGELTLTGLGRMENTVLREKGSMTFPVPEDLPAGTYPLAWELHARGGKIENGLVDAVVEGYRLVCGGAAVSLSAGGASGEAVLSVQATKRVSVTAALTLRGPDGTGIAAGETAVRLQEGTQELRLPFPFKPEEAGLWELSAALSVQVPDGPGLPPGNTVLASCGALFDAGDGAVLGLRTEKPVYDEPVRSPNAIIILFGNGSPSLSVLLDGKKKYRESLALSGLRMVKTAIEGVTPGAHALRAELAGAGPRSVRVTTVVNGADLPDLVPSIVTGSPTGVELDVGFGVMNRGKAAAGKSRAALYDGDPDRGGKLIGKADIPPLAPGRKHVSILKWPLLRHTGERRLVAIADPGGDIPETNERNNRAEFSLIVPDYLLNIAAAKKDVGPGEPVSFSVTAVNLTDRDRKDLSLALALAGADERAILSETVSIADFPAAKTLIEEKQFLPPTPLPPGAYLLTAVLGSGGEVLANTLSDIHVSPVLSLTGSFEGTPSAAVFCGPLPVSYSVSETGNVPATAGSLTLAIAGPQAESRPAVSKQLPLSFGKKTFTFERVDVPAGNYLLTLTSSAENSGKHMQRELELARKPLTVSPAVAAAQVPSSFLRALIWTGGLGGLANQAAAESVVRQAFPADTAYVRIARSQEEFASEAANGIYNVFILLEVGDTFQDPRWLKDLTREGGGMIIVGADEPARTAAGAFGFSFDEPLSENGAALVIEESASAGLAGTIPVSGAVLAPRKRGAVPLASKADTGRPVVLMGAGNGGKVAVVPFSLIRSARDSGASGIYGLFLRMIAAAVTPEKTGPGGLSAGGVAVSATADPVKARITVTFPEKTRLLWSNRDASVHDRTAVYDLIAEKEPQTILYVHTPAEDAKARPSVEIFTECGGSLVSQGKME